MKSALHIVEISPCIYSGAVNKYASLDAPIVKNAKGYYTPSIATGGLAFMFNKINDYKGKGEMIFVADRNPTIKKEMFSEYKSSRYKSRKSDKALADYENINNQREMAEIILKDCGFQVLAEEGYEGDDLLYSVCKKYSKDFSHIFIHADDSDNFINVTENVSCLPCASSGKIVSRENYEVTVDRKSITPYSSLTFSKVLFGDTSDSVPALRKDLQTLLIKTVWNDTHFPFMREKEMMRALINHIAPEAIPQYDLIYPLDVEVEIELESLPNQSKVESWGNAIGCNRYRSLKQTIPSVQEMIEQFFLDGRSLEG